MIVPRCRVCEKKLDRRKLSYGHTTDQLHGVFSYMGEHGIEIFDFGLSLFYCHNCFHAAAETAGMTKYGAGLSKMYGDYLNTERVMRVLHAMEHYAVRASSSPERSPALRSTPPTTPAQQPRPKSPDAVRCALLVAGASSR